MPKTVPQYPSARSLEISDKAGLQECFNHIQPVVSELSFANLYLFRHAHRYAITSLNNSLVIMGCGYDNVPYFLQPLSGNRGETARKLLDLGKILFGADERFVGDHMSGKGYLALADRDNDDYLYLRSELAELPGNRFHGKRNRINHFAARHAYTVEPFSKKHIDSALNLLDKWHKFHPDAGKLSLNAEVDANREGIEFADSLGLSGVAVLVDNKVSAFALGESLNDLTTTCVFEKADPELEGLAQLVNREFSRIQPVNKKYVNRQQDLGDVGLKEAKSSYHPVAMIRKFKVMPEPAGKLKFSDERT